MWNEIDCFWDVFPLNVPIDAAYAAMRREHGDHDQPPGQGACAALANHGASYLFVRSAEVAQLASRAPIWRHVHIAAVSGERVEREVELVALAQQHAERTVAFTALLGG